jgi:hypothetical protein
MGDRVQRIKVKIHEASHSCRTSYQIMQFSLNQQIKIPASYFKAFLVTMLTSFSFYTKEKEEKM